MPSDAFFLAFRQANFLARGTVRAGPGAVLLT
jgi:hypothetical protein